MVAPATYSGDVTCDVILGAVDALTAHCQTPLDWDIESKPVSGHVTFRNGKITFYN